MTAAQTQKIKILIKRPDEPPEIAEIEIEGRNADKALTPLLGAKSDWDIETCEYNSSIRMFYTLSGRYNFSIAYQTFTGAVAFVKRKSHHRNKDGKPLDISPADVKRIKAALNWR